MWIDIRRNSDNVVVDTYRDDKIDQANYRGPVEFRNPTIYTHMENVTKQEEIDAQKTLATQSENDYRALLLKIKTDIQAATTAAQIKAVLLDIVRALRF